MTTKWASNSKPNPYATGHYWDNWKNLKGSKDQTEKNILMLFFKFQWLYCDYVGDYPCLLEIHTKVFRGNGASSQQLPLK